MSTVLPSAELEGVSALVKQTMEQAMEQAMALDVPLLVTTGTGRN